MLKLIIQGTLPGLNDYIEACRANKYKGAELKQTTEEAIQWEIIRQLKKVKLGPSSFTFRWYEPKKNRDKDNIAFAKKFIFDALQAQRTLAGDGWNQVIEFSDRFYVDATNPRVEIEITEVEIKDEQPKPHNPKNIRTDNVYWKEKADRLARKEHRAYKVIQNAIGDLGVCPATLNTSSLPIYETTGAD